MPNVWPPPMLTRAEASHSCDRFEPSLRRPALSHRLINITAGILLLILPGLATAQEVPSPDSAKAQIRTVLRAFYMHLQNQNWDALSPYVLSPKLLERRGGPEDVQTVSRDRTRLRGAAHAVAAPKSCPAKHSALIDEAAIRLDGDWAEVSVPRCTATSAGVDELRMLYFEERWRFIYTDLFESSPSGEQ